MTIPAKLFVLLSLVAIAIGALVLLAQFSDEADQTLSELETAWNGAAEYDRDAAQRERDLQQRVRDAVNQLIVEDYIKAYRSWHLVPDREDL